MTKLVSFLLPTHNSHDWLLRAVKSIKDTASDFSSVEIVLRMHDDDTPRFALIPRLVAEYNAKILIAPGLSGYTSLPVFMDEMCGIASGYWCWMFDDDAWLEGNTWQQQLSTLPRDPGLKIAAQAEVFKRGSSRYPNSEVNSNPQGLILPRTVVRPFEHQYPIDVFWRSFIHDNGWKIHLLRGITWAEDGRPRPALTP